MKTLILTLLLLSPTAFAGGGGGFFQHLHERFSHCRGGNAKTTRAVASQEEEHIEVRGEYARILFEGLGADKQTDMKSHKGLRVTKRESEKGWCKRIDAEQPSYLCGFLVEEAPDSLED